MLKSTAQVLTVIIPTYNESATVLPLLDKVRLVELRDGMEKEIIMVDDCSGDTTVELIRQYQAQFPELGIQLYQQASNQGKGAALHVGIARANGDFVLVQDADLEYEPAEYNDLLKPMLEQGADVVYGSRFTGNNPHRASLFWHAQGNRLLTFLTNIVTNLNLTDMETCYKLFRREVLQGLSLREKRFGFEPEVTIKMSRVPQVKVYEVGISYYGRSYAEGKKIGWRDGVRALLIIARCGLLRLN